MNASEMKTGWMTGNELPMPKPFDHHCPLMGTGNNMYLSRCKTRQRDPSMRDCYQGCKAASSAVFQQRERKEGINQLGKIIELLNEGYDRTEISQKLGCHVNKVSRVKHEAKKAGILTEKALKQVGSGKRRKDAQKNKVI